MLSDSSATSVFQGHGILLIVGKSFYEAANSMLSIVGLNVITALEIIGVLLLMIFAWLFVQGMRGKGGFTLYKGDGRSPSELIAIPESNPDGTTSYKVAPQ